MPLVEALGYTGSLSGGRLEPASGLSVHVFYRRATSEVELIGECR